MTAKQLAAKGETARALLIANRVIEEVKASPKNCKQQELLMEATPLMEIIITFWVTANKLFLTSEML